MSRLVAEHGWSTELAVHGVFGRWESIVGAQVAAHCRPRRFVDGRLTVGADSTAWATEVRLLAPMVLQRLNDELGDGIVSRIEVEGPQPPSWRHGRFSVRNTRGPRDTYG
jgi:predicted nucleic acid-binding Zn ribbon protein